MVDLSVATERAPDGLRREVESWAKGRGLAQLADPGMQRALSGPEAAGPVVARLVSAARAQQDAGDCAAAAQLARAAETAALTALTVDEEREPLKSLYVLMIACEDKLGHADLARAAGVRLRTLVSLSPSALPRALWERYVPAPAGAPDAGAGTAPAPGAASLVELTVDSDPPNARVAINFHLDGVTPRTLKVHPGVVYVEVEKAGFKKAFRKITVDKKPERAVFALADRRQDRAAQIESTVAKLRGSDPATHPTTMARLAELARVDVLVAIAVNADTVRLWWFDSDRGDLVGDPIESHFDPRTGRLAERLTDFARGKSVAR
ncbi:MAG TPA: PEGA domain-containing protein [Polyangia bacterium]|nr:PEGA domain-containing protein [Polyangia bacterium]